MLELADRRDLGSRAVRREGSNPSFPIHALGLHTTPTPQSVPTKGAILEDRHVEN